VTQTPAPARSRSGGANLRARLFPGDRRLWLCAAAVIGVGAIAILVSLLVPRDYFTGTNSIRTRGFPVELRKGDRVCVPDVQVPAGTGRIEMEVWAHRGPLAPIAATLSTASGRKVADASSPAGPPGRRKVEFTLPKQGSSVPGATLCLRAAAPVLVGGLADIQGNDRPLKLNGKDYPARLALWFRPPAGQQRSLLSHPGEILDRAALMRPGWVGTWTYWVLLIGVMPLLAYAAVRLLASAEDPRRSARRLAVTVGALGLLNACAWALVTTPFNAPDESEHFAYVQYFAETGHETQREGTPNPRGVYSVDESYALDTVRILSWNEAFDGRPPWTGLAEKRLVERQQADPGADRRDTGGGPTPATWAHSPAYYATLTPAYFAGRTGSSWDELTLMRFTSALYAAIVAACAFLLVRELLLRQRTLAVAAGLLVAFHPMLGFIGGAVNNDNGVNALAAVVILLTVRGIRRGLTVRSGVALGAALALLPIMKATGFALYPLVALAGLGMLVRRHSRRDLIAYATAVASVLAVFAAWSALSGLWDQPAAAASGGGGANASTAASGALDNPLGYLSYLWQVFLPPLPFMTDLFIFKWPFFNIYIERGWAAFGWYAALFPRWVYSLILVVTLAVGALGARAAWRYRDWVKRHWLEVAFVCLVPVTVLAAVEAAYFTTAPRQALAEFGRYLFPAMTALAALAVGSCLGLGRRWAPVAATGLVAGVIVLDYASQLLSLASFYT
jgi:hypothetical protein